MSLFSLSNLGIGGTGLAGEADGSLYSILKEEQGLTVTMVAGAAAGTKMNIAAMRQEDTILAMFDFTAATPVFANVDLTHVTIQETHATGTVTAASVSAADTATVNGLVYTAAAGTPADFTKFNSTGTDTQVAASLAAAINARESQNTYAVQATSNGAVVTVRAVADGTAGNALALATSNNTRLAKSGTTLSGGTATGGIKCSDTLHDSVFVFWKNKH